MGIGESLRISPGAEGTPVEDVLTTPNIARIYDRWLGGKDNFGIDREVARKVAEAAPRVVSGVRANRAFLRRAVTFLAAAGIDQFLDLGSGLPTSDNVHQVAGRVNPDVRVVYVDNDPVVLAHARALLADHEQVTVIDRDIRVPEGILDSARLRLHLDFSRPVAVLFVAILHFVREEEDPAGIIAAFREVLAPGSALVISHVADGSDQTQSAATRAGAAIYTQTTAPFIVRTRAQVARLFTGLEMVPPGLVDVDRWHRVGNGRAGTPVLAGVGILPVPDHAPGADGDAGGGPELS